MPEEVEIGEVGVDKVSEEAHEKAHEHGHRAPWLRWLALSTAFFAVFAAIAALLSGHFSNEAILHMTESTLKQAEASDQYNWYQAKQIKAITLTEEATILRTLKAPDDAIAKADETAKHEDETSKEKQTEGAKLADEQKSLLAESKTDLENHHRFAYVVTTLQVAIGLAAIAALMEKRWVWFLALVPGAIGLVLFVIGAMHMKGGG